MKDISLIFSAVFIFLAGCANPYRAHFESNANQLPEWVQTRFAPPAEEPRLRLSDDMRDDSRKLFENGHIIVARSQFEGPSVDIDLAMSQGKKIGADVVLVQRKFARRVNDLVSYTQWTPETTTEIRRRSTARTDIKETHYDSTVEIRSGGEPVTVTIPKETDYYQTTATYWRRVENPVLGLLVRDLSEEERRRLETNSGLFVWGIMKGSPGFTADIFRGDIITKINGERPPLRDAFYEWIGKNKGKELNLELDREGKMLKRTLKLNP